MYRPTESVDWCQCCQQGVSFPYAEGTADFFGDDDSAEVVHSSDNAGCFHSISFSFSVAYKAPLCKGGWQKSLISDWGIVFVDTLQSLRHGLRRATSRPLLSASQTFSPLTGKSTLYTREALHPYNHFTNYAVSICKTRLFIHNLSYFSPFHCYK